MIGIESIGTYLPVGRIDNRQRMAQLETDETFLSEKTGMLRLAIKADGEETSDLCIHAYRDLQAKTGLKSDEVECIVVCTQNPDGHGLPQTSAIVHGKLDLPESCAAFDISLGCSGFVYSLSVIQGFMQANGFTKGVLFTADPYSKIVDQNDKNTCLLFGDGATASLISSRAIWRSGKFLFGSRGKDSASIEIAEGTDKVAMNGRSVFAFSATVVPKNIITMLAANCLSIADIDIFVLHQGSRYIVDNLQKRLGVDSSKVPFLASDYGNTVSSSIPLLLNTIDATAKQVVIAGFGVGLSWASTVLSRVE